MRSWHDGAMTDTFVKTGSASQIGWEAAGLAWLRAARGGLVVPVLGQDERQLVTKRLLTTAPTKTAAGDFGRALARTHAAGAAGFGAPPDGWDPQQPGWIGTTRLPLGNYQRWGLFYAELRVLPHAYAAHSRGALSAGALDLIEKLCQRLRDGEFDDGRPAARIHGDLWSGNLLSTPDGLVMIDPAAHGGHPMTDLAMLELFGYPQLRILQDAYAEAAGLGHDWHHHIRLHQLHPLLVHAELFGGSYGAEAMGVAHSYA